MKNNNLIQKAIIAMIKGYQILLSPLFPPSCRFHPTCSEYSIQAFSKYGIIRASYLTLTRILRCNPFTKGGYDPLI